ncbi:MAG: PadR family transcriptional regulator [Pseudomonadota bacterium]
MARRKNISQQTRKVLSKLLESPNDWWHGYDLSKATGLKSGTLYPILVRLHDQGFLISDWQEPTKPGRPPRHIYRLSPSGVALAETQRVEQRGTQISPQERPA